MQKIIGAWAAIAVVLGVGHTLWGWWGVVSLATLGIVTYIGYEFYQYIMYDATRVRDSSHSTIGTSFINDYEAITGVPVNARADHAAMLGRARNFTEDRLESTRRHDRRQQLDHLETDLEHAKTLMKLEKEAHRLRTTYAQRNAPYSQEVEDMLRDLFEEIERMKRGEAA